MIEPRQPIYQWGQRVRAAVDLVNDGSHPQVPTDALIVALHTPGEVVNIGHHADTNSPVYLVEFLDEAGGQTVVGCIEEELEQA